VGVKNLENNIITSQIGLVYTYKIKKREKNV